MIYYGDLKYIIKAKYDIGYCVITILACIWIFIIISAVLSEIKIFCRIKQIKKFGQNKTNNKNLFLE